MTTTTRERGEINVLLVPFIFILLFFIGAVGFGFWAFAERQDYKNNVDMKIADAVEIARQEEGVAKDRAHAEADKQPLRTYRAPDAYGGLQVPYPKTWSGYVSDNGKGSQPVDGYFSPGVVPSLTDQQSVFALRVQVLQQPYANVSKSMENLVKQGQVTAVPFAFPQVPDEIGVRYEGTIRPGKKLSGTMIIIPLRDKTLQVWTESPNFNADFNNFIIPNFTFVP